MGSAPIQHDIPLTATLNGDTITITGSGGESLPGGTGAHRFNFTLHDDTGLNVEFDSLDCADNCSTCPPPPGENSSQIIAVTIQNQGPNDNKAGFTDNNDNDQPMPVAYQWNFTCDDPGKTVTPFDPIIINGGSTAYR